MVGTPLSLRHFLGVVTEVLGNTFHERLEVLVKDAMTAEESIKPLRINQRKQKAPKQNPIEPAQHACQRVRMLFEKRFHHTDSDSNLIHSRLSLPVGLRGEIRDASVRARARRGPQLGCSTRMHYWLG